MQEYLKALFQSNTQFQKVWIFTSSIIALVVGPLIYSFFAQNSSVPIRYTNNNANIFNVNFYIFIVIWSVYNFYLIYIWLNGETQKKKIVNVEHIKQLSQEDSRNKKVSVYISFFSFFAAEVILF